MSANDPGATTKTVVAFNRTIEMEGRIVCNNLEFGQHMVFVNCKFILLDPRSTNSQSRPMISHYQDGDYDQFTALPFGASVTNESSTTFVNCTFDMQYVAGLNTDAVIMISDAIDCTFTSSGQNAAPFYPTLRQNARFLNNSIDGSDLPASDGERGLIIPASNITMDNNQFIRKGLHLSRGTSTTPTQITIANLDAFNFVDPSTSSNNGTIIRIDGSIEGNQGAGADGFDTGVHLLLPNHNISNFNTDGIFSWFPDDSTTTGLGNRSSKVVSATRYSAPIINEANDEYLPMVITNIVTNEPREDFLFKFKSNIEFGGNNYTGTPHLGWITASVNRYADRVFRTNAAGFPLVPADQFIFYNQLDENVVGSVMRNFDIPTDFVQGGSELGNFNIGNAANLFTSGEFLSLFGTSNQTRNFIGSELIDDILLDTNDLIMHESDAVTQRYVNKAAIPAVFGSTSTVSTSDLYAAYKLFVTENVLESTDYPLNNVVDRRLDITSNYADKITIAESISTDSNGVIINQLLTDTAVIEFDFHSVADAQRFQAGFNSAFPGGSAEVDNRIIINFNGASLTLDATTPGEPLSNPIGRWSTSLNGDVFTISLDSTGADAGTQILSTLVGAVLNGTEVLSVENPFSTNPNSQIFVFPRADIVLGDSILVNSNRDTLSVLADTIVADESIDELSINGEMDLSVIDTSGFSYLHADKFINVEEPIQTVIDLNSSPSGASDGVTFVKYTVTFDGTNFNPTAVAGLISQGPAINLISNVDADGVDRVSLFSQMQSGDTITFINPNDGLEYGWELTGAPSATGLFFTNKTDPIVTAPTVTDFPILSVLLKFRRIGRGGNVDNTVSLPGGTYRVDGLSTSTTGPTFSSGRYQLQSGQTYQFINGAFTNTATTLLGPTSGRALLDLTEDQVGGLMQIAGVPSLANVTVRQLPQELKLAIPRPPQGGYYAIARERFGVLTEVVPPTRLEPSSTNESTILTLTNLAEDSDGDAAAGRYNHWQGLDTIRTYLKYDSIVPVTGTTGGAVIWQEAAIDRGWRPGDETVDFDEEITISNPFSPGLSNDAFVEGGIGDDDFVWPTTPGTIDPEHTAIIAGLAATPPTAGVLDISNHTRTDVPSQEGLGIAAEVANTMPYFQLWYDRARSGNTDITPDPVNPPTLLTYGAAYTTEWTPDSILMRSGSEQPATLPNTSGGGTTEVNIREQQIVTNWNGINVESHRSVNDEVFNRQEQLASLETVVTAAEAGVNRSSILMGVTMAIGDSDDTSVDNTIFGKTKLIEATIGTPADGDTHTNLIDYSKEVRNDVDNMRTNRLLGLKPQTNKS